MQNSITKSQAITPNEDTLLPSPSFDINDSIANYKSPAPWLDVKKGLPLFYYDDKKSRRTVWSGDLIPINLLPMLFKDPKHLFSEVESFQGIIKRSAEILDSVICPYPRYKRSLEGADPQEKQELDGAELFLDTEKLEYLMSQRDGGYKQERLKQLKARRDEHQFWLKPHGIEMVANAAIITTLYWAASAIDLFCTPLAFRIGISLFAAFVYTKCLNNRLTPESGIFNLVAFLVLFGMDNLFNTAGLPQSTPNNGLTPSLLLSAIHSIFLIGLYNSTVIFLENIERIPFMMGQFEDASAMIAKLEGKSYEPENTILRTFIKKIQRILPKPALQQESLLPLYNDAQNTQNVASAKELEKGNVEEKQVFALEAQQPRPF